MAQIFEIASTEAPTTLNCLTPNCTYHVEFDGDTPAIPALIKTDKVLKTEITGVMKVYLTCDNPVTPHTNAYRIKIK